MGWTLDQDGLSISYYKSMDISWKHWHNLLTCNQQNLNERVEQVSFNKVRFFFFFQINFPYRDLVLTLKILHHIVFTFQVDKKME